MQYTHADIYTNHIYYKIRLVSMLTLTFVRALFVFHNNSRTQY